MSVRTVVLALYALAALLVGFGHRPMAGPAPVSAVDLAAYALPDGTAPELCSELDRRHAPDTAARALCDACLTTAVPGLVPPEACSLAPPERVRAGRWIRVAERLASRSVFRATSRGPPLQGTA